MAINKFDRVLNLYIKQYVDFPQVDSYERQSRDNRQLDNP